MTDATPAEHPDARAEAEARQRRGALYDLTKSRIDTFVQGADWMRAALLAERPDLKQPRPRCQRCGEWDGLAPERCWYGFTHSYLAERPAPTPDDREFRFTDAEWREYQNMPEQGYSHRHHLEHVINQRIARWHR